jgi:hypothetical protein
VGFAAIDKSAESVGQSVVYLAFVKPVFCQVEKASNALFSFLIVCLSPVFKALPTLFFTHKDKFLPEIEHLESKVV